MLSPKIQETLEFINKFLEKNGRPPRLKELSVALEVTNKAVLDRLQSLEDEGYITMPDGVLSLRLKRTSNDIFISYAHADQKIAQQLYDFFVDEGFKVWKDNMEIRTGDNFVSEIFENIRRSKCVLALLSKEAAKSNFVLEEIACAKKYQMESSKPIILPIKIAADLTAQDIPAALKATHYATLKEGFDHSDLSAIANQVHVKAYEHEIQKEAHKKPPTGFVSFYKKSLTDLEAELKTNTPPTDDYPYRECTISALGNDREYKNFEIEKLVQESIVKIQGWGGDRFPAYYYDYNEGSILMNGWIKAADMKAWTGKDWGFNYWSMDKCLNFFTRASLRESFNNEEIGRGGLLNDKFSVEWLILDVCRPILFIQTLQSKTGVRDWRLHIKYHGLKDRELVILSQRRMGFLSKYQSKENDMEFDYVVEDSTNLKELAYSICFEIFTIFNWRNPNEEMLRKDIDDLFSGRIPQ